MGHKRSRERMEAMHAKLVDGMVANGIDRAAAEQLFHMLEGFADYGFPESHAASFALLAYASAYLKCHLPAVFAAAILNVQPMGFLLDRGARQRCAPPRRDDPSRSKSTRARYWSHVERDGALAAGIPSRARAGRGAAQAVGSGLAGRERSTTCSPSRSGRSSNARRSRTSPSRAPSHRGTPRAAKRCGRCAVSTNAKRAASSARSWISTSLPRSSKRRRQKELVAFDLWSTGVTPSGQVMEHFRKLLAAQRVVPAARLAVAAAQQPTCRAGGLVITRQRPGTAKGFVFLTLEDETGIVNVIVRPDVYETYRRPIRVVVNPHRRGNAAEGVRLRRRPREEDLELRRRGHHPNPRHP